uniref:POPDC1-3 domain-containing protein n=1 Tax=Glossina pallidipes TaxID=7398 RepID=A0A1A9ZQG3_GLOPL
MCAGGSGFRKFAKCICRRQEDIEIAQIKTGSPSSNVQLHAMLLISALALGLVETTNLNTGIAISGSAINSVSVAAVHIPPTTISSIAAGHVNTVIHAGVANAISTSLLESTTMTAVAGGTDAGGGSGGGSGTSANNGATSSSWDNNATIRSANPGDWSIEQCVTWQRPHHLYFQLGNAFLLLAFLAPHGSYGTLWLRAMLTVGSVLLGMYGYMIDCAQDFVLWSGLFFGVNFIYFVVILCQLRPVRFDREIEAFQTNQALQWCRSAD